MIRENADPNSHKSCPKNSKGKNSKIHAAHYTFHIGADGKLYSTDSHLNMAYNGVRDFCIDKRNYTYEENGYEDYYINSNYTYQSEYAMEDENTPDTKQCNTMDNGEAPGPFMLYCAMPTLYIPKCCKENEMINVRYVSNFDGLRF